MHRSEDLLKTAIYGDTIAELIKEVAPESGLEKSAHNGRLHASKLSQEAQNLYYIGEDTRSILSGPDIGSDSLEQNIKSTTNYINKLKSLGY